MMTQTTPILLTYRTADGHDAVTLIGHVVQIPRRGIFGVAEHLTADGWLGVRQPGGGLDEFRAAECVADPT